MLSALLLFLSNRREDERAGQEAEEILQEVRTAIAARENAEETERPEESEEAVAPTVELDGELYIGVLTIPDLNLELPVMADWDYERLKRAPCRQFGAAESDDLVIAAHNYKRHFGALAHLQMDAAVSFTGVDGGVIAYRVARVASIDPKDVDAVQYSGYDLVLYTCTYGGSDRVAVFCDREESVVPAKE